MLSLAVALFCSASVWALVFHLQAVRASQNERALLEQRSVRLSAILAERKEIRDNANISFITQDDLISLRKRLEQAETSIQQLTGKFQITQDAGIDFGTEARERDYRNQAASALLRKMRPPNKQERPESG